MCLLALPEEQNGSQLRTALNPTMPKPQNAFRNWFWARPLQNPQKTHAVWFW
jgi:hypothetical protein